MKRNRWSRFEGGEHAQIYSLYDVGSSCRDVGSSRDDRGSSPAAAYDYPYCLQGKQTGIPGDCNYESYAQCMASASGRDAYCAINPRVAYGRQIPRRGQRYYDDY